MKVIEHLNQATESNKTLFSFEILPPKKGEGMQNIFDGIDPLMEFKPAFVDVTYHREEFVYREVKPGLFEKRTDRKRPGTVGICSAIMHKYHVDTVPHIICGGFSKEETENALIDLHFLGIETVLALRGDSLKSEGAFSPHSKGHHYASELISQIKDLNRGKYFNEEVEQKAHTNYCIGVAGYPEKHFEAPNFDMDIKYLKEKVDLGAEYIVTQMFFDNQKFFHFVDKCREAGIQVPIIPGLKPLTTRRQLNLLPSVFHIDIPDDLVKEALKCKTNADVRQVGIEWGIQQSKELMEYGVPSLHYYSMGKSTSVRNIAMELF